MTAATQPTDAERLAKYEVRNVMRGWDMIGPSGTRAALVKGAFDVGERKEPLANAKAWQAVQCVQAVFASWEEVHFLPEGERPEKDPYDYWERVNPVSETYGIAVVLRQAVERLYPEGEWRVGRYPGCNPPLLAARVADGELVGIVSPVWIEREI